MFGWTVLPGVRMKGITWCSDEGNYQEGNINIQREISFSSLSLKKNGYHHLLENHKMLSLISLLLSFVKVIITTIGNEFFFVAVLP